MTDQITQYFESNKLTISIDLPLVLHQINKDISQSGGDFSLDVNQPLIESITALNQRIQEWLTHNQLDVRALLYRIDVSEKDILNAELTPLRITELIFKREIIKIRFRKEYSAQS